MDVGRARLGTAEVGGAELDGGGAGGQGRRDTGAGRDPAGGDEGSVDPRADELQRRQQAEVADLVVVDVGAPVTTGFDALDDEGVGIEELGGGGFVR